MQQTPKREQLRVLIISGSRDCRVAVRAALAQEPLLRCELAECDTFDSAKRELQNRSFELVVIDTSLEDVRWLAANTKRTAVVFLSEDEKTISPQAVLASGAIECFVKAEFDTGSSLLGKALKQTVRFHAVEQERQHLAEVVKERDNRLVQMTQRLWKISPYDDRTGWFNHRKIIERMEEEVSRSRRYKLPFAIVLADIRGLEDVGEREIVSVFDRLLTEFSTRARRVTRQTDVVGHFGPNGFLFLLTITDLPGGVRFCQRVNEKLSEPLVLGDQHGRLSYYFGVTAYVPTGEIQESAALIEQARARLQRAISNGQVGGVVAD